MYFPWKTLHFSDNYSSFLIKVPVISDWQRSTFENVLSFTHINVTFKLFKLFLTEEKTEKKSQIQKNNNKRSKEKENIGKTKIERKRDVSFIYPHASVLLVKEGTTKTGSPNLLSVSPCFWIDFSDKVQNHFSTPLHPLLPLSLTLFIISSHISTCSLTHNPHGCLKSVLEYKDSSIHSEFSTQRCPWHKRKKYVNNRHMC